MVNQNNPAGRLFNIIEPASKKPDKAKVREVWQQVLNCDGVDEAELTKRVIEVYTLCQEVQKLIKMIPDLNHELYLSAFPNIEKAIFPLHMGNNWQNHKRYLDEGVLAKIQFSSEELKKHYSEETISEDDLLEVKTLVEELFETVSNSNIDPTLRLVLLEELEKIRSSIAMFRIKGAKGIKEALQSTLGAVYANQEKITDLKKSEPGMLKKLSKLLDKIDSFTAAALRIKKILGPIIGFLGNGNTEI